jgi:hypothetical protein
MKEDIQELTDIGYKRKVNKKYPLMGGHSRSFCKCKKCKTKGFYDYIPYSLRKPIITTSCGHFFKEYYKPF